jgi:hypothetical protein
VPRRAEPTTQTLVPVPSRFFVTSGKGINKTSELNAFDLALLQAGIGEQNLVNVSSVLPIGVRQVDRARTQLLKQARGLWPGAPHLQGTRSRRLREPAGPRCIACASG